MKKKFAIGGAVIGFAYGVAIMVSAFLKARGSSGNAELFQVREIPGNAELFLQIGIVAVLAVFGSILGLFIGWLLSLLRPNKNEKKPTI